MKRSVNLLACLGVFVVGIVLAQANDGTEPVATAKKPCCEGEKKSDTPPPGKPRVAQPAKPALGLTKVAPWACLQYLLYEDEMIALWSADEYEDDPCLSTPFEVYLWTKTGLMAPQTCESGCEGLTVDKKSRIAPPYPPILKARLPANYKYFDRLPMVPNTRTRPIRKWDPKEGLTDLGEMQFDYISVTGADDNPVYIKLSAGIAETDKVRYAGFPPKPKISKRTIAIGLEADLPEGVVASNRDPVTAYPWDAYPDNPTTFTVDWEGTTYYVTAKNPVKLTDRPPNPSPDAKKPAK